MFLAPRATLAPAADAASVTPPADLTPAMTDDGTATGMNDDDRLFDWRLDHFKRRWRDRRGFRYAGHHAESKRGGDNAFLNAFQRLEMIF
jgi:hypothetical protein